MSPADAGEAVRRLRRTFSTGRTRPLAWRRAQLERLAALIVEREEALLGALHADLGKPRVEAWPSELGIVLGEIDTALAGLERWAAPEEVHTPWLYRPSSSRVFREPLGVALIIGPWNYPVQLLLSPLVGALAAGNCVVLKPSELSPATSSVLASALPRFLDGEAVSVVEGGPEAARALLDERFDALFFTGGETVGRIVMEAAARHLTPVTLELGGKCPCIVLADARMKVAARRICWGKFFNAGQTCVAPDHILVEQAAEAPLLAHLRRTLARFYGDDPRASPDYARIVNARHLQRLRGLLGEGEIVVGGTVDEVERYVAPTVIRAVPEDAPVMREEIFGPILPVVAVPDLERALGFVNARPKPLALYLFTEDEGARRRVLGGTSSGSVCVNDTMVQIFNPELPFGGVGASGLGAYHGRAGFETFSHRRAVLERSTRLDVIPRYPPYDESRLKWIRRVM
jgi:aldehyde dehydrogenase (NAD+)